MCYFFPAAVQCNSAKADVVFLVDSSRSVCDPSSPSCSNWQAILNFVARLITSWNIGSNAIQVGLVLYSTTTSNGFFLNTYTSKSQLLSAISTTPYPASGSQSAYGNLLDALNNAVSVQFTANRGSRYGVPKVEVIISGGGLSYFDRTATCTTAANHYGLGIVMYGVGISGQATANDLMCISSPPQLQNYNYFVNDNSGTIAGTADVMSTLICNSASADCSRKVIDLVLMLDSSNSVIADNPNGWSVLLGLVVDAIDAFNIGPAGTRVGVVTFADTIRNSIWLSSFDDRTALIAAVRALPLIGGSGRNIMGALNATLSDQFTAERGDRSGDANVALILTTGAATSDVQATIEEAEKLFAADVKVFAIGVSARVNLVQLANISSPPRLANHQWWYADQLDAISDIAVASVLSELCRAQYGNVPT